MSSIYNRLTIQTDLSGFSFKIYDKNGTLLHSEERNLPINLFNEKPSSLLLKSYSSVNVYVSAAKSTLIPSTFYSENEKKQILSKLSATGEHDEILSLEIPSHNAVMVYTVEKGLIAMISSHYKNVRFYPIIYFLIDRISSIDANNRLLAAFSENRIHIVAAEREKLILANSYPASDIVTAEYFLLSVSKEAMFNPEHTSIYISGFISESDRTELSKYFTGTVLLQ